MSHSSKASFQIIAPQSKFYRGPFGRICGDLPAWQPSGIDEHDIPSHFLKIAQDEMIELPGATPGEIAKDNAIIQSLENQFSSKIPAGYTYFGQFIDHDITFDPASDLMRRTDPSGLLNHRTPRMDLDNVYGRGPSDSPYLYDQNDKGKMLIGKITGTDLPDLPRNSQGRALIGDMRNDENSIVSQLQLAFLCAHNTLVDRARAKNVDDPFKAAQKTLRWLYQYISWNDFIRRICIDKVYKCALTLDSGCGGIKSWKLGLKEIYNWKHHPFMPVEFSGAAYRFGHSMVRNSYQTNHLFRGAGNFAPIFDNSGNARPDDLRGFRKLPKQNAIQWDWFLDMTSSRGTFPQRARKIDTKLSNALAFLHEDAAGSPMNVLAFRNMQRGYALGLPSGTSVAKKLCVKPIDIEPDHDSLWFYILKEAELLKGTNKGESLGMVGSTIVAATFAGLLKGDPCSWINNEPCWSPDNDPLLNPDKDKKDAKDWTLASIIRLSGLPVSAADFTRKSKRVGKKK